MTHEGSAEKIDVARPDFALLGLARRFFSVVKDRPLLFLGLAAVAACPIKSWVVVLSKVDVRFLGIIGEIVERLFGTAVSGVFAYIVFQRLKKGSEASLSQALFQVLKQFLPLVGIILMVSIPFIFGSLVGSAVLFVGVFLVFFLLSLNFWIYCAFLPVVSVCVVEKLGFVDSLKRSLELTYGMRESIFYLLLKVFGVYLLAVSLYVALNYIFFYRHFWELDFFYRHFWELVDNWTIIGGVRFAFEMIIAFFSGLVAVVYCDLADYNDQARLSEGYKDREYFSNTFP